MTHRHHPSKRAIAFAQAAVESIPSWAFDRQNTNVIVDAIASDFDDAYRAGIEAAARNIRRLKMKAEVAGREDTLAILNEIERALAPPEPKSELIDARHLAHKIGS